MIDSRTLFVIAALLLGFSTTGCAARSRQRPPRQGVAAQAATAGLTPLGQRQVAFAGDHDTILVTATQGRFRALRLHVSGSPLEMFRVKVTFGNGQTFEPPLRHVFRQGAWTRRIDLPGKRRVVRKVEFWYRSVGKRSGRARVQLAGQH